MERRESRVSTSLRGHYAMRLAILLAATAVVLLVPASASATHFTGSVKECQPQNPVTMTFDCLLTIQVDFVRDQTVVLNIESGPTGASFTAAPTRVGGTCPATGTITLTNTGQVQFGTGSGTPAFVSDCTILLQETLEADAFGEVCQILDYASGISFPVGRACAQLVPPLLPTDKDLCKNGIWQAYLVFKNQGDCVSFVATGGKNEPGKNT
jgi:hypothetical protein